MSIINDLKKKLIGTTISEIELDEILEKVEYVQVEDDDEQEDGIIKYTNYRSRIWVDVEKDGIKLHITKLRRVTKVKNKSTKTSSFHSPDDLKIILDSFMKKGQYHHWLCGWIMMSVGRRIGDTMSLKWSDLFFPNGSYRLKLTQLEEEKTGKIVAPPINALLREGINKYCAITGIDPIQCYNSNIFTTESQTFRKALGKVINEIGFNYPISAHSFRKFYGNTIYKIHPQDADCLSVIQFLFGHSDLNTTKLYIDLIDEKGVRFSNDYSQHILDCFNGERPIINNSPVVTLRQCDLRDILTNAGIVGADFNKVMDQIEQRML